MALLVPVEKRVKVHRHNIERHLERGYQLFVICALPERTVKKVALLH